MTTMTARVTMTCTSCGNQIHPGTNVQSDGAGGPMHVTCSHPHLVAVTPAMVRAAALVPATLPGVSLAPISEADLPPIEEIVRELPAGARYVAVDAGLGVGGLFMWTGSGQTDRSALAAQLDHHGFGKLSPRAATVEAILRRCLARGKKAVPGRTIVSVVERNREWAVVQELRAKDAQGQVVLEHRTLLHARLTSRVDDLPGSEVQFTHVCDALDLGWLQTAVRADHQQSLDNLSVDDVTAWLQYCLTGAFGGVQTMPGCRQYFVPADKVPDVRRFCEALRSATRYEVYEIPAMRSEAATTAILAALEREAVAAAEEIQRDIGLKVEEMAKVEGSNGMARRAQTMTKRLAAVDKVNKKLAAYAEKFGRPADAAANQVARLRRNVFLALQYAEARAEGVDADAPRLLDLSGTAVPSDGGTVSDGAEVRFAAIAADFVTAEVELAAGDPAEGVVEGSNDGDPEDRDEILDDQDR